MNQLCLETRLYFCVFKESWVAGNPRRAFMAEFLFLLLSKEASVPRGFWAIRAWWISSPEAAAACQSRGRTSLPPASDRKWLGRNNSVPRRRQGTPRSPQSFPRKSLLTSQQSPFTVTFLPPCKCTCQSSCLGSNSFQKRLEDRAQWLDSDYWQVKRFRNEMIALDRSLCRQDFRLLWIQ